MDDREVWLAEKSANGQREQLGVFSDPVKARKACQDQANEYFGERNTPLLNWHGNDGHSSASHYQPGEMSFFQVTRFRVDQVTEV